MTRRGSYAKGIAKREEILRSALSVVAREGYHGASVRELAEEVGLSQAGLLHYFEGKDELFVEILRTRDELDMTERGEAIGDALGQEIDEVREAYLDLIRHNAEVPGLVELFTRLSADAANPQHPSRAFFRERGDAMRDAWATTIAAAQESGRVTDRVDPALLARLLQAVTDGAQMQWLVEPELDMAVVVDALFALLLPDRGLADERATDDQPVSDQPTDDRASGRQPSSGRTEA
ncbi:AcrR family transcriptional regulator [Microbacterium resistens]|uniref:AcrR family transcriptional regulator n=1 Tax=Microbacterium resistens TaxID=156977 RepID=A0ABU1SC07_9MICO|nr:helix-turn-helix domain-containing protein [Microbacterium resistens]MDR6867147.1 AcrR family transcriptional regulator [Microbacterium resistens]